MENNTESSLNTLNTRTIKSECTFRLIGYHSTWIAPTEFNIIAQYEHYRNRCTAGDVWAGLYTTPKAQVNYGPYLYAIYIDLTPVSWILTIPEKIPKYKHTEYWNTGNLNARYIKEYGVPHDIKTDQKTSHKKSVNPYQFYIGVPWKRYLGDNLGIIEARNGNDSDQGVETLVLPDLFSQEHKALHVEYLGCYGAHYNNIIQSWSYGHCSKSLKRYTGAELLSADISAKVRRLVQRGNIWPLYTPGPSQPACYLTKNWWGDDKNIKLGRIIMNRHYDLQYNACLTKPYKIQNDQINSQGTQKKHIVESRDYAKNDLVLPDLTTNCKDYRNRIINIMHRNYIARLSIGSQGQAI